jgi:hypothetical protein
VTSDDALALVLEHFRSASAAEDRRSARALLEWQADARTSRVLAPLDERAIAWEATAVVKSANGRTVPYQRTAIEIAGDRDHVQRNILDSARAALVEAELVPIRRERFARERDLVDSLGLANGYVETFELVSGVPVRALAQACRALLRDTQAMWDDVLPGFLRQRLGIRLDEATRADGLALQRAPEFDPYFPASSLRENVRGQVESMGVDPEAEGRVIYDIEEREGKRSRAFCAPVRVPAEVYLVMRPHGGASDYRTFLHELGHALHYGYARPDLPFEHRWLGDNAVTESFAMLFDHQMHDRGWLSRYTELGNRVDTYVRSAGLEELQFLRRYAAKLIYEIELYGGELSWSSLGDLYVETLSSATSFRYRAADALIDVDPGFYAARYLRAWQLQATLRERLVSSFDEDWYRNPRAGPWIVQQLFGEGQREMAEELAMRVSGTALTFDPVIRAIETRLTA